MPVASCEQLDVELDAGHVLLQSLVLAFEIDVPEPLFCPYAGLFGTVHGLELDLAGLGRLRLLPGRSELDSGEEEPSVTIANPPRYRLEPLTPVSSAASRGAFGDVQLQDLRRILCAVGACHHRLSASTGQRVPSSSGSPPSPSDIRPARPVTAFCRLSLLTRRTVAPGLGTTSTGEVSAGRFAMLRTKDFAMGPSTDRTALRTLYKPARVCARADIKE